MWWQFQAKPPFATYLPRIIGPDACPENAAIINNEKFSGHYLAFYIKRPTWPHIEKTKSNREILDNFRKTISKNHHFYYLYYGQNDYTNDPIFANLASRYLGKSYTYELPTGKETIILFDIHPLLTATNVIDKDIAQQQAKGMFPQWTIEGFQARLQTKLK